MTEEFAGVGNVEKKEEALKKTGEKYWKVKIDGLSGSLFDHEMGEKFGLGDQVEYSGTNKEGINPHTGDEITFHNFNSVVKKEIVAEQVQPTPIETLEKIEEKPTDKVPMSSTNQEKYVNPQAFGLACNQAQRTLQGTGYKLPALVDEDWNKYEALVLAFYKRNGLIKEKLQ